MIGVTIGRANQSASVTLSPSGAKKVATTTARISTFSIASAIQPIITAPLAVASGAHTAELSATVNVVNSTLYWVVSKSSTKPSKDQITAGKDSTGAAAPAANSIYVDTLGIQNDEATGLTGGTDYYAHFLLVDFLGTPTTVATTVKFTTTAIPALSIGGVPPGATVGTAYNFTVSIDGGEAPYSFAVTSGTLPPGLTLNTTTGAITGTPS